ncbi:MAG: hypothetical protein U0930_06085 [Pirellulales bacterium]
MQVIKLSFTARLCVLALLCSLHSGCVTVAGLQDMHFSCSNKLRASDAWRCSFTSEQRRSLSCDFESGFKKGYYDTAMNKDCRLPPIAPPKYWAAKYQTCEGQCAVQDWFRGYQHGIAVAQSGSCSQTAEIPISPGAPVLNKTGCGACYSPDCCKDANCNQCGQNSSEEFVQPYHYEQTNGSKSVPASQMIDMPDSKAIIPVSFQSSGGLIGGYGNRNN